MLGHIQRGGAPSARDRVLASRMGAYAVEMLMQGMTARAVGIHNHELVDYDVIEAFQTPHLSDMSLYTLLNELSI